MIPLVAAEPVPHVPAQRTVASTTQVSTAISEWLTSLFIDQGLVEPEQVSTYPTRAHLWFRDGAALGTMLAWAEQLDSSQPIDVRVDRFADSWHAVLVTGAVRGVEVLLHVVTRAALPDRVLGLDDLREHVDNDRATRAVSDVPAVLPEGQPA